MSTEALLDDPPEAGLAWITLLLSSGLLGALFVWSLQNPSVLLPSLSAVESNGVYSEAQADVQSDVQTSAQTERQADSPLAGLASEATQTIDAVAPVTIANAENPADIDNSTDTPLEKLRRQELATLPGLAGRVRYNPEEAVPLEASDKLLNRMFELLFLYIDSDVVVKISSADFEDDAKNVELSQSRAQNLVAYLVDRGLDEQRFDMVPLGREELPLGGHRVNVYAKNI